MTNPRAFGWRSCRRWCSTGARATTGETTEVKLNALPEFVTTIDGVDIQFIRVRSREPNALPLILTHTWPASPLEFLKVIGPLTDPVAFGGRARRLQ
jgi:hypothetical protein